MRILTNPQNPTTHHGSLAAAPAAWNRARRRGARYRRGVRVPAPLQPSRQLCRQFRSESPHRDLRFQQDQAQSRQGGSEYPGGGDAPLWRRHGQGRETDRDYRAERRADVHPEVGPGGGWQGRVLVHAGGPCSIDRERWSERSDRACHLPGGRRHHPGGRAGDVLAWPHDGVRHWLQLRQEPGSAADPEGRQHSDDGRRECGRCTGADDADEHLHGGRSRRGHRPVRARLQGDTWRRADRSRTTDWRT